MRIKKDRFIEVKIVGFTKTGDGIGFFQFPDSPQLNLEVPFTMPGDFVRARIIKKRGRTYYGVLEEIITPSPDRIVPKCIHFATCGGCRWQHLTYQHQLAYKEAFIKKVFIELITPDVQFRPILASPQAWHYRNKMEYTFSTDQKGHKYLGLMMDSTRGKVFNLLECHLTNSWFVDALKSVKNWWNETSLDAYYMPKDKGTLRNLTLREGQRTGDRMVILTVSGNADYALNQKEKDSFIAFVRDAVEPINPDQKLSIFLRIKQIAKGMPTNIYEMLLYGPDYIRETLNVQTSETTPPVPINCIIGPSSFFQPNPEQAERIYSIGISLAGINKNSVVYDLYCGTGILSICAAKHAKQVIGIELLPEAVINAQENAKNNNVDNAFFISGAVRHTLKTLKERGFPDADIVMVDPPRAGIDPLAMKHLISVNASKILYISCNPITQAENIAELSKHGYKLTIVQPIDQFPQTYHVENIAILSKVTE